MNKRNAPNPHCLLLLLLRRRAVGAEEEAGFAEDCQTEERLRLAGYVLFANALRIQSCKIRKSFTKNLFRKSRNKRQNTKARPRKSKYSSKANKHRR